MSNSICRRLNSERVLGVALHSRTTRAAVVFLILSSVSTGLFAQTTSYVISDLGPANGGSSNALGLNDTGMVVGSAVGVDSDVRGFLWDGSLTLLEPLGEDLQACAFAINDSGQVVIESYDLGELYPSAMLWHAGVVTVIEGLAPRDVNNAGVVAGTISIGDPSFGIVEHAATWSSGILDDLGTLGGHFSSAFAVNDAGQTVGVSFTSNDASRRATLWAAGQVHDLGTLGGANSHAYDINNFEQVVGVGDTSTGESHAFVFVVNAGGSVISRTDLGTLAGTASYAFSVNDIGDVVGTSDSRAFHWSQGIMTDLNTMLSPEAGWRLEQAWAINNQGQIVGFGYHDGWPRRFLLDPTVECLADIDCVDGNVCNGSERCMSGTCASGKPLWCGDGDQCTGDHCDAALGCQHDPIVVLFGDVAPNGGDGTVDLDDILCVLSGFANPINCPDADLIPCGGDSIVNLDDILAVLAAFQGQYACPHPCPP